MDKETFQQLTLDLSKNLSPDILEADFKGENFFEQFQKMLSGHITQLLRSDYGRLLNILYRVDVDENIAKSCFDASDIFKVADALAGAIIDRQLQKIKFRKQNPPAGT